MMEDKFMTKILVSILSVLVILFPFSSFLVGTYQQLSFPGKQEITEEIIDAVKSNDIDALEKMLSERTKKNLGNPQEKIADFLQNIEGEIINAEYHSGSSEKDESGGGYVYSFRGWKIKLETTEKMYLLRVNWIRADTREPDKVGLDSLILTSEETGILAELYN